MMLDLRTLGRELRERRRMLRISSAELARRIGVSPTYVWLIESASPRKNGLPSRPSEEVLRQWTQALGMGPVDAERMLGLAGYFGTQIGEGARPLGRAARVQRHDLFAAPAFDERASYNAPMPAAPAPAGMAARFSAAEPTPDIVEEELKGRVQRLLRAAASRGRAEEVAGLVRSHLQWLQHVVDDEDLRERNS